jgi:AraC-like DNA-binding protein
MTVFQSSVVDTRDPELVAETMRNAFGSGFRISMIDTQAPAFHFASAASGALTLLDISLNFDGEGGLDSRAVPPEDQTYIVGQFSRGARLWSGRDEMDLTRPVLYPDQVASHFDRAQGVMITIRRDAVQTRARQLTGLEDLRLEFTGTAPVQASLDGHWRRLHRYAAEAIALDLEEPSAELLREGLTHQLAVTMLALFASTASGHLTDHVDGPPRASTVVRRATAYIDEHLHTAIDVTDIAAAVHLSVRSLQAAFRRELDITPTAYLRRARLAAARADLLAADRSIETVANIAARWGFVNTGRFADLYRAAYGEYPRRTLER